MPEAWHGRCLQWDGRAIQSLADPKHQKLGMARACSGTAVHDPHPTKTLFFPSFSIILQQQHLSSLKPLSKTSITTNLQTFIPPSNLLQITKFLHPNNSIHHPKHNSPIKNNFHPSTPKFTQNPIPH